MLEYGRLQHPEHGRLTSSFERPCSCWRSSSPCMQTCSYSDRPKGVLKSLWCHHSMLAVSGALRLYVRKCLEDRKRWGRYWLGSRHERCDADGESLRRCLSLIEGTPVMQLQICESIHHGFGKFFPKSGASIQNGTVQRGHNWTRVVQHY